MSQDLQIVTTVSKQSNDKVLTLVGSSDLVELDLGKTPTGKCWSSDKITCRTHSSCNSTITNVNQIIRKHIMELFLETTCIQYQQLVQALGEPLELWVLGVIIRGVACL